MLKRNNLRQSIIFIKRSVEASKKIFLYLAFHLEELSKYKKHPQYCAYYKVNV